MVYGRIQLTDPKAKRKQVESTDRDENLGERESGAEWGRPIWGKLALARLINGLKAANLRGGEEERQRSAAAAYCLVSSLLWS